MKVFATIALCLISFALCSEFIPKDSILNEFMGRSEEEIFKVYHFLYNKGYELNSEEGELRRRTFKENMQLIKSYNARLGRKLYGITPFTDITNEEFRETYLMKHSVSKTSLREEPHTSSKFVEEDVNIDWRPFMNKAKDQKQCGSCWAFAAVATIEGNYNIQYNKLLNLSEQFFVDCDGMDGGCHGGFPDRTLPWIKDNGVVFQENHTYKAIEGHCSSKLKRTAQAVLDDTRGFEDCKFCSLEKFLDILKKGPMIVAMDAGAKEFQHFKPTSEDDFWEPSSTACVGINHAVTAVGARVQNGRVIITVRNSWSENWGLKGHFRVPADNSCLVTRYAWRAVTKPLQELPTPTCPTFYSDCNFTGKSFSSCISVADFEKTDLQGSFASFDAVDQRNWFVWTGYEGENCSGVAYSLSKGNQCTTNKYPKRKFRSAATRFGRRATCANLYEDTCFGGESYEICGEIPNIFDSDISTNINSMYMNPGSLDSIVFYPEKNFGGVGITYSASKDYLNLKNDMEFQKVMLSARSMKINKIKK